MDNATKEIKSVEYNYAAVKILHFKINPYSPCFSLHWHDRIEIIRVKKGQMMIECFENTITLREGEMILFTPRMAHKGYTENQEVDYDVLMFDIRTFYNQTPICNNLFPKLFDGTAKFETVISDQETIACTDKICNNEKPDSLEITSLVYKLIYLLFEKHLHKVNAKSETKSKLIINYIEENYMFDLNTEILSKEFGYSTEHFCRKFKAVTGITPMTYLRIFRLEQSLKMIKSGEGSISEIAAQCGFNDANYFTRCFKAHYGVPPKQYKNKN